MSMDRIHDSHGKHHHTTYYHQISSKVRNAFMRTRWIIIIFVLGAGVVTWAWINDLNQQVAILTPPVGVFTPSAHVYPPNGPSASAGGCPGVCGTTINVPAGGSLQTAINSANIGDTINLAAGATYAGSFTLPNKPANGSAYLTITTAGFSIAGGQRVKPSDATSMAKLTNGASVPMILTAPGANHYQLIGLEMAPSNNSDFGSEEIRLGDSGTNQNTLAQVPHDLILDRLYLHAFSNSTGAKRGVTLNSSNTDIINSYIADFKETGQDAQAICGWNGPGNLVIKNNYLEGSGENVLLGGADPSIPGLNANVNVQVRNNFFFKPYTWMIGNPAYQGNPWNVKNIFESKHATNLVLDGNLLENSWLKGQTGAGIVIKSTNQGGGAPQSVSQNQSLTNNIIAHVDIGIAINGISGFPINVYTNHITVNNNLFQDVSAKKYGGYGYAIQTTGTVDFSTITHNTFENDAHTIQANGPGSQGFIMQNNISGYNTYGIIGSNAGPGDSSISLFFPSAVINHNVLAGGNAITDAKLYKNTAPSNFFIGTVLDTLFVNAPAGDFHLASGSPYHNAASDGTDIGVNYAALNAAQASSSAPIPTSTAGSTGSGATVAPVVGGGPGAGAGPASDSSAAPSSGSSTSNPVSGISGSSSSSAKKGTTSTKVSAAIPVAVIDSSKSYVRVDGSAIAADDKHFYSVVIGVKDFDGNFILKQKPSLAMGGGQTTVTGPTQVGNEWIYTVSSNQVGDRTGSVTVGAKTLANIKITFLPIELAKLKQDQLVNIGAVLGDLEAKLAAEQANNPTLLLASPAKLDVAQKVAVGSLISFTTVGLIWWIRRRFMLGRLAGSWNSH